ncbi:arginine--tRNA ligase [Fundicoccus culcitae]|uniref:Arginine--tRNA ligase n=1 Tax=Fundicoccus culcitae TaxID=2969821 RepID=A0ABY5P736_9LACT|nr:arginine--tRNA ligase [Fundicoccus culcitae]UUX34553.1 arginine--tRNA ligase [Fundicoccus culcitae]
MQGRQLIVDTLLPLLNEHLSAEEIERMIEVPANPEHGDLAFPVYTLARTFRKAPNLIAADLVEQIDSSKFDQVVAIGPYINFLLDRNEASNETLKTILDQGSAYGSTDIGTDKNVPIDMSSPNIAKPMSMGHLRSTVIGNSVGLILEKLNYNVIRINHLGDWGTQFGKLIVAYQKWGDEAAVMADPVNELVKLYVDFHEKAEKDPTLEDEARAAFKKLEDGDPEMIRLWTWFKDESLKEFTRVYEMLDVQFDSYNGEAFYNDKMQAVVDELEEKGVSTVDNGATIVDLEAENLPPALIKKSDGATLYMTRDLATAYYRYNTYHFDQSLYVVGNEQSNHFKQLKAVLKRLGNDWADDMHHIPFGLITLNGKKLSTRKGQIVLLEKVLNEAIELAMEQIVKKNPDLENKEEVAHQVGVGAVIFHDLKTDRLNSFDFNLEEVVQFEGETGPYVQYTHARAHSILEKYNQALDDQAAFTLDDDYAWAVIKKLDDYPAIVQQAATRYEPSVIAKYVIQLAQLFNKYYGNTRILDEDEAIQSRIALVKAVTIVLKDGLGLLGIKAPNKM